MVLSLVVYGETQGPARKGSSKGRGLNVPQRRPRATASLSGENPGYREGVAENWGGPVLS
jgi:hypothetical protein